MHFTKSGALLLGAVLITSGGAVAPMSPALASSHAVSESGHERAAPSYSDDELLMAVLFGTGRAAGALGLHIEDDASLPEDFGRLARGAVEAFREERPREVQDALSAFRSGDPIGVHDAVRSVQSTFQHTFTEGRPVIDDGALCATVNLVLAGNLAVAINVGFAVTVAFVTWVVTYQVENRAEAELLSARLADLGQS